MTNKKCTTCNLLGYLCNQCIKDYNCSNNYSEFNYDTEIESDNDSSDD